MLFNFHYTLCRLVLIKCSLKIVHYCPSHYQLLIIFCIQIDFADFLIYVKDNLRAPGVPLPLIINDIEKKCWWMAESSYKSEALNGTDLFKVTKPEPEPPIASLFLTLSSIVE